MNSGKQNSLTAKSHAANITRQAMRFFFAHSRLCAIFFLVLLAVPPAPAQEIADTIRVRTRVVFMDALVKDKRTGIPISDLQPENFEVFDDGRPRPISYFTREGQARKPLALILILDCREDGAARFLKRPEILKAMTDELAKLPPSDEVGIMAMNIGEDEKRIWLTHVTNNRHELAAALARVSTFVENPESLPDKQKQQQEQQGKGSVTIGADSTANKPADKTEKPDQGKPGPEDIVSVETIKGKNGAIVTRTVLKDGSVNVKRVNSSGNVTIELDDVYDMAAAVREATHAAQEERHKGRGFDTGTTSA